MSAKEVDTALRYYIALVNNKNLKIAKNLSDKI